MLDSFNALKVWLVTTFGLFGSVVASWFGGWTEDLTTLLIFMGIDIITGLMIAAIWKRSGKSQTGALNSVSMWKGLCRKGFSLLIILVAHRLDVTIGVNYIKTAVVIAFIVNEAISITENAGIIGIPMPPIITKAIDVLKNKSNGENKEGNHEYK